MKFTELRSLLFVRLLLLTHIRRHASKGKGFACGIQQDLAAVRNVSSEAAGSSTSLFSILKRPRLPHHEIHQTPYFSLLRKGKASHLLENILLSAVVWIWTIRASAVENTHKGGKKSSR